MQNKLLPFVTQDNEIQTKLNFINQLPYFLCTPPVINKDDEADEIFDHIYHRIQLNGSHSLYLHDLLYFTY